MPITAREKQDFQDAIMPMDLLERAIDWIRANLSPEEVFTVNELEEWAEYSGYGIFDKGEE